jgi:hypothetical protein
MGGGGQHQVERVENGLVFSAFFTLMFFYFSRLTWRLAKKTKVKWAKRERKRREGLRVPKITGSLFTTDRSNNTAVTITTTTNPSAVDIAVILRLLSRFGLDLASPKKDREENAQRKSNKTKEYKTSAKQTNQLSRVEREREYRWYTVLLYTPPLLSVVHLSASFVGAVRQVPWRHPSSSVNKSNLPPAFLIISNPPSFQLWFKIVQVFYPATFFHNDDEEKEISFLYSADLLPL